MRVTICLFLPASWIVLPLRNGNALVCLQGDLLFGPALRHMPSSRLGGLKATLPDILY